MSQLVISLIVLLSSLVSLIVLFLILRYTMSQIFIKFTKATYKVAEVDGKYYPLVTAVKITNRIVNGDLREWHSNSRFYLCDDIYSHGNDTFEEAENTIKEYHKWLNKSKPIVKETIIEV